MDEQGIGGKFESYEQQLKNIALQEKNTQEQLSRSLGRYESGGMWSRDTDSAGKVIYNWLKDDEENWQRLRDAIGDQTKFRNDNWMPMGSYNRSGTRSHRAEELGSLSAEEMWKIRENDPALWEKILDAASRGYEDASEYLNALADLWEKEKEVQEEFLTSVTTVSFDSLKDSFADALMSMEEDARKTSENISKMMSQALINSMINDEYAEKLKDWRERLANVLKITDINERNRQLETLKKEYQQLMDEAGKEADAIKEMTGYTAAVKAKEQSATAKGIQNITQEQASALEGLETAQLIVQEQIKAILEGWQGKAVTSSTVITEDKDIKPEGDDGGNNELLDNWLDNLLDRIPDPNGNMITPEMDNFIADMKAVLPDNDLDLFNRFVELTNGNESDIIQPIVDSLNGVSSLSQAAQDAVMMRDLLIQNLDMMQSGLIGTFDELRTLTIQANSTRETMLKLMKERYESFDNKLTNIYKELQAQA